MRAMATNSLNNEGSLVPPILFRGCLCVIKTPGVAGRKKKSPRRDGGDSSIEEESRLDSKNAVAPNGGKSLLERNCGSRGRAASPIKTLPMHKKRKTTLGQKLTLVKAYKKGHIGDRSHTKSNIVIGMRLKMVRS